MTADKSEAVSKAELSRINRKHLFNTRFSSLSLPHSNFKSSGPCGNSSVSLGLLLLTFWIRSSMRIHGVVSLVKPEPMEADTVLIKVQIRLSCRSSLSVTPIKGTSVQL